MNSLLSLVASSQNFFFLRSIRERARRGASRPSLRVILITPPAKHQYHQEMRVAKVGAKPLRLKPRSTRFVVASARRRASSFFDDDPFFSSASSLFDDLDREVADLGSRIASEALPPAPVRRSSSLGSSSRSSRERESEQQQQQQTTLLPGGKGFARTRSSSGRTASSSWSSSESVVVWGVEPPSSTSTAAPAQQQPSFFFHSPPGQLAGAALLLYAAVAARFARATRDGETKYKTVSRWKLALLWPVLAALSPEFKQELKDALKLERGRKRAGEEENASKAKEAGGSGGGVALFPSPEGQRKEGADASPFDER